MSFSLQIFKIAFQANQTMKLQILKTTLFVIQFIFNNEKTIYIAREENIIEQSSVIYQFLWTFQIEIIKMLKKLLIVLSVLISVQGEKNFTFTCYFSYITFEFIPLAISAVPKCPKNEIWKTSGSGCEKCADFNCFVIIGKAQCYCRNGYCRNSSGNCVLVPSDANWKWK